MKTTLTIDSGNTSVKACIFQNGECKASARVASEAELQEWIAALDEELKPKKGIYSNVTGSEVFGCAMPDSIADTPVMTLRHDTPLPFRIGYTTPATLGLDRIAAAAGAERLLKADAELDFILVADAGTALTLDLIDSSPTFIGGNISPGLRMRLLSLHEHTGALPEVTPEGEVEDFGTSTLSAIRSGCTIGMAAEIVCAYAKASAQNKKGLIALTGGDANALQPYIDKNLPLLLCPELVAQGLNRILHYNEDNL